MSSATFSVAVDTLGPINLLDPSGTVIAPGQPGVTITDLSAGRIFTVSSPQTGNWRLQVAGTGSFSVAAQANSSIQFNSFQFVALSGRAGHEGLFPIPGQPII